MGQMAARFVSARMDDASRSSSSRRPSFATSNCTAWERCFSPADQLSRVLAPGAQLVHAESSAGQWPTGWQLVDSGVAKGIQKLGLVSDRVGDVLSLGPLGPRLDSNCSTVKRGDRKPRAVFHLEVGYRLSRRDSFGAFALGCSPCDCRRLKSTFAKQISPFPFVDTNARLSPNEHYRDPDFNATITAMTTFRVETTANDQIHNCTLHITHVSAGSGLSERVRGAELAKLTSNASQVTIESLNTWCDVDLGASAL